MTHQAPIAPEAAPSAPPGHSTPDARNGPRWTPAKMAQFLRALAATHSVSAAAASVGMSRQSAHNLRARTKGRAFDLAWDEACKQSYANLAYAAIERALNGTEVPVYYKGEKIDSYRRYDERLTVALLRLAGNPHALVIGAPGDLAARQGRRFAGLLGGIEAQGEAAEAPPPEDDEDDVFDADSANLSSMSDARLMAEMRRFRGKGAG